MHPNRLHLSQISLLAAESFETGRVSVGLDSAFEVVGREIVGVGAVAAAVADVVNVVMGGRVSWDLGSGL